MTEYRVIFLTDTSREATAELNALSADGWRFLSTIGTPWRMGVIMARGEEQQQRTNWEVIQESRERAAAVLVEKGTTVVFADGSVERL